MQTLEQVINSVPLVKKENVTVNRKVLNSIFALVVYVLLNNMPLFGVEKKERQAYRFSVIANNHNSIFAIGRMHIFIASIFVTAMFKNKTIISATGIRRTNLLKNRLKILTELLIGAGYSYTKTTEIFKKAQYSPWVPVSYSLFNKLIVFLELIVGALILGYLQDFCTNYGFVTATRLFLIFDYCQGLIDWLFDAKFKIFETGIPWHYSILFSAAFLYIIVLIYDYYYELSIEHSKAKGINEVMPIRYMFCDTTPLYLSSYFKEIAEKIIVIANDYFKIKPPEFLIKFIHSNESFFYHYISQNYWLILAESLYICISFPLIMFIWAKLTNNNTADELVSELIENDRVIKGARQTKQDMLDKIQTDINVLTTSSVITSVLLTIIGQTIPLIGNIDSKGFIINAVILIDLKNEIKKLKLEKSGKYIFYLHKLL